MSASTKSPMFWYSVDVLIDGSERTGPPTIFVSAYKTPSRCCPLDLVDDNLQSRYAISGLGDLLNRAASDQRFKLHPVRAVFAGSMIDLQGLPGLLAVLCQAGRPELTVVSADASAVELLVQTIQYSKYKKHPAVRICQVPEVPDTSKHSNVATNDIPVSWWNVYEDVFLQVHGSSAFAATNDPSSIVYLFTFKLLPSIRKSLLLVPKGIAPDLVKHWTSHLPVIEGSGGKTLEIFVGVLVDPSLSRKAPNDLLDAGICWYEVSPRNDESTVDPNLLVRAQQQSRAWNKVLPTHFPWKNEIVASGVKHMKEGACDRLVSGTSMIIRPTPTNDDLSLSVVDRLQGFCDGVISPERGKWPEELVGFLDSSQNGGGHRSNAPDDKNEIDLDEILDEDAGEYQEKLASPALPAEDASVARLLVLGTGCASPSPYRGSSGYAFFLPGNDLAVAIEVGEGFVTQWGRYADGRPLNMIELIWISVSVSFYKRGLSLSWLPFRAYPLAPWVMIISSALALGPLWGACQFTRVLKTRAV
jgi:hypothetical protein